VQGPNVVGGYAHPDTGKPVSMEEHRQMVKAHIVEPNIHQH
jgi:hypothetical protein